MSDRAHHGVVPGQTPEIIVTLDGKTGRRGSGYRVGPTAVLTAAHVIEGAVAVRVRFDADLPGEWSTEAIPYWADPRSDLAVLSLAPHEGEPPVAKARFGRISARAAVLAVQAVGFPRFKLKTDDGDCSDYRDSHQADGSVAVLSNRREGTLEVTVPPPEPDPDASPWEGMSGAAVWVGDRIVGVITKHHRSDGLGRLAAARLDLALDGLDANRHAELRALVGLPDVLPDVVPPSTGEQVTTAYQAQVRDIAPDRLLDREEELDELVGFCAGDQPYAWWQAGPWAGKSALMAWFVLHPPAGVDVVSFFVTARLAGQSDSDACTDALIEQLAALLGESPATLLTTKARRGIMLRLLEDAASRAREAGHRLLMMIDGLDEDSGTTPSIAALLPRRPPPEVRILVASRPHPPSS
ncbi:MAG: trypsin-like peptidase domain-containing protein [Pseudonocardiaceae bacterium]